uniref:Family with sequence similarity 168 member B n=1 Tax=Oryctolagus cuniculus TaxID=9986 RepID=A0A5F9C5U8_RABIT
AGASRSFATWDVGRPDFSHVCSLSLQKPSVDDWLYSIVRDRRGRGLSLLGARRKALAARGWSRACRELWSWCAEAVGRVATPRRLLLPRPFSGGPRPPPPPASSSSLARSRASPPPTVGLLGGYCRGFRAESLRRRLQSLRAIRHPTGHGRGSESVAAVASREDKGIAASAAAAAAAVFACSRSPDPQSSTMNPVYSPVQPGAPYGNPKNMAYTGYPTAYPAAAPAYNPSLYPTNSPSYAPGYTAGTPYKVPPTQSNTAPPPYSPSPNPYQTAMYPIRSAYPQQNLYAQGAYYTQPVYAAQPHVIHHTTVVQPNSIPSAIYPAPVAAPRTNGVAMGMVAGTTMAMSAGEGSIRLCVHPRPPGTRARAWLTEPVLGAQGT